MLYCKTIGKSVYKIDRNEEYEHYRVYELYNGQTVTHDPRLFKTFDDAFTVLKNIDRERAYSDPSYRAI